MKKYIGTAGMNIKSFFVQNHETETQKLESALCRQSKNTDESGRISPRAGDSSSLYLDTNNIQSKSWQTSSQQMWLVPVSVSIVFQFSKT